MNKVYPRVKKCKKEVNRRKVDDAKKIVSVAGGRFGENKGKKNKSVLEKQPQAAADIFTFKRTIE